jgi:uncharacterized C2H2 Zn-finger protein
MEEVSKTCRLRRINRRVVWGPRGFTDGETNFSVRDINYSLKDFEKNNGFRIKPAFTLYSTDSDNCSDTSEGSDTSEDTSKASHPDYVTGEGSDTSEDTSDPVTREESKEGKKKEKCAVCGKNFLNPRGLARHKNRVHSQTKFHCPKCPKSFSRTDSLSRHQFLYHRGN